MGDDVVVSIAYVVRNIDLKLENKSSSDVGCGWLKVRGGLEQSGGRRVCKEFKVRERLCDRGGARALNPR